MFFDYGRGDKGQTVRDIQQALNTTQAASLKIDGIYGPKTEAEIEKVKCCGKSFISATPEVFEKIGLEQIAIADISDHQYKVDFEKLRDQGVKGVIIKASEGFDWKTKNIERFKQAKEAGLLVGAYHFGRPDLHQEGEAPYIERDNFNEVVERSGIDLDFLPVYDFEKGDKNKDEWSVHYCVEWHCEHDGDVPAIIYTAEWALDLLAGKQRDKLLETGSVLWFADYTRNTGKRYPTDSINPWQEWSLWQHTAKHFTDAVLDRNGKPSKIDMNWTHRGRLSQLLARSCKP